MPDELLLLLTPAINLAVRLPLVPQAVHGGPHIVAWPVLWIVITLVVVLLHTELHGNLRSVGPEVGSGKNCGAKTKKNKEKCMEYDICSAFIDIF